MSLKNLISVGFTQEEVDQINQHLAGIQELIKEKVINLTRKSVSSMAASMTVLKTGS